MHKEILLNEDWLFHKGDIEIPRPTDKGPVYMQSKTERKLIGPAAYHYYDKTDSFESHVEIRSEGWRNVNIPHDYVVAQDLCREENNAHGFLKYDNAWYRKHFTLGEEYRGKRLVLLFEGIAGHSMIYLNGCLMRRNFSSYSSFSIDISANAYFDRENVLAVYVNTEEYDGWWYQGGGIYRDVTLLVTDPVAIDLYGVYAPARKLTDGSWRVDFETTVVNDTDENCVVSVKSMILDAGGHEVAAAAGTGEAVLREHVTIKYSTTVSDPILWDTENPYLYTVKTELVSNGRILDESRIRIGFRTIEVNPQRGLYLNGKHTVIKGVCCHQDFGLTGLAVPDNIARYKIKMMKEMGANGFRTSHYQNSAANMDAFDEMGFLVMDENRCFEATDEAYEQLETMVKRDRNRPSVVFWSTGNEEPLHITENGKMIHRILAAKIRKLDDTRMITTAEDKMPEESTVFADCDVIGINYNLASFDKVHEQYPEKPILVSECCATGTTRDWNYPAADNGRLKDKDRDTNDWFLGREKTWKFFMERPYIMGAYQWAAVEHRGEAVWPRMCSCSGAIDIFLQRKGAFYQNQSHWTETPMVHVVTHWNFKGLEGLEKDVVVYTNCEALELFLNGKSLGRKEIEKYGHGEWTVCYEPGELKAVGYRGGEEVAMHVRKTSGSAARLVLKQENECFANGRDMLLLTCTCLDENGNEVPDAEEYVRFWTSSPAKIVATGSANDDGHNVANTERQMYMGRITVGVLPAKGQENVEIYAKSAGCGTTMTVVELKELQRT